MKTIKVETTVNKDLAKVWEAWNTPSHIKNWAFASDDWGVGEVENDLKVGGKFKTEMHAKDGSVKFDFGGTYNVVNENSLIVYTMADGRKVEVSFEKISDNETKVTEVFEMESENSEELQKAGWQAILTNFKKYCESLT